MLWQESELTHTRTDYTNTHARMHTKHARTPFGDEDVEEMGTLESLYMTSHSTTRVTPRTHSPLSTTVYMSDSLRPSTKFPVHTTPETILGTVLQPFQERHKSAYSHGTL